MQDDTTQAINAHIAAREAIEISRAKRSQFSTILMLTLMTASAALLWINVGVLSA